LAIGYGTTMTNTNEVFFAAGTSAAESAVYNAYSTEDGYPSPLSDALYTTTITESAGFITFVAARPLDPTSNGSSFALTLDDT
jgi:hypothetical protein